jgi:phosphoglycolate phosphatase-like HAD superfamily hydrolase
MVQRKNGSKVAVLRPAIIFDFDGTIADSLPAVIQVFEELTGRVGQYSMEQAEGSGAYESTEDSALEGSLITYEGSQTTA